MKSASLNYFIGQIKKVIYVFHVNRNSFGMIFITIIQPEIHKRNGFLKIRFDRVFILISFFASRYLLCGHHTGEVAFPQR